MNLQEQLRPLLAQFTKATGRGNIIAANDTMARIIQYMAAMIDHACANRSENPTLLVQELPIKRSRGRPKKQRD